ncbi:Sec-independent protein translocase protein TatB [Rhodoblastus sp.]|uniref:Sec-independent protein translocase protein TatB n=1 Tax=Rhodoblastus sp. TaxID=1962975 RepID=UPI003F9594E2
MFDFDVGKLLLIGVVALIFIPPKDLPEALRQLGRLVGKARRMAAEFQSQFNEAIRDAELDDLKSEFRHLKDQASAEKALRDFAELPETGAPPPPAATLAESPAGPPAPETAAAEPAPETPPPEPAPAPPAAAGTHS